MSNFNAKSNLQGTGTTIVQLAPSGALHLFATITPASVAGRCPGGVGLSTALVVLRSGWVVVGSLPTTGRHGRDGGAGCLIVLNANGKVVETFHDATIDGPWDMTALDRGSTADLFVTNVLHGTVAAKGKVVHGGTVVRLVLRTTGVKMPAKVSETRDRLRLRRAHRRRRPRDRPDRASGSGPDGTLYVADTLDVADHRDPDCGDTDVERRHRHRRDARCGALNAPLGLAIAPNGDILTVNGGDGNIVETTPGGTQVATKTLDSTGGGGGLLFGLAVRPDGTAVYFVDDGTNTLALLH